jgi:nitrite reductase/ring-hydroxylating ferredoxin subunit/uncharacterized membrane protein
MQSIESVVGERVAQLTSLDPASKSVQGFLGSLVPSGSRQKDLLSGRWLGHPLHPLLTDVVIGAWTGGVFLDLFGAPARAAADRLIALGVLAAVPTAAAGLSDWSDLGGPARRIGAVHALGNTTALALFAGSWWARSAGRRGRGVALSMLGMMVAGGSAWLGGHLTYTRGVGVNRTAFETFPKSWQTVADADDVEDGTPTAVRAGDVDVLLVRQGERIHAMSDTCSHLGCSLHDGTLEDGTIVCPCHGSAFALDGTVVRGPATASQPSLDARVEGGKVQVRRARSSG